MPLYFSPQVLNSRFAGCPYLPIEDVQLSARLGNCLRNLGIENLADLNVRAAREVLECYNFGRKSFNELREIVAEHGGWFDPGNPETPKFDPIHWCDGVVHLQQRKAAALANLASIARGLEKMKANAVKAGRSDLAEMFS